VTLRLLVRAGAADDPSGKAGVASLAAALLDQGTATRTAAGIADTIDSIGGSLEAAALTDVSVATVVVLKDGLGVGLDLLSDVVRHPAFDPSEVDRQRRQALSGLAVSAADPDSVASAVFDRLVYGAHPYGQPALGTPRSLAAISADDLRAFHARYFAPNNAFFAIAGDVEPGEAFDAAERAFGGWERREVVPPPALEPPPPARRVVIVDKPDAVQTEIRVGQRTIPRTHPDHLALDLAIRILGGAGSNRLQRVLRSERGLTYGAEADLDALVQAGDFVAATDTRTETTAEVLRLVVDEIATLRREGVSARELSDAQAALTGSFPLTIETPEAVAWQVLDVLSHGLPPSDLDTFRERVLAVTVEDVERAARTCLRPERLSIVLVGNARAFASRLTGLGFDAYEIVPLAELDLSTGDRLHTAAEPEARQGAPRP
jgi:zinc protease